MVFAILAADYVQEPIIVPTYRNPIVWEIVYWLFPMVMLILGMAAFLHAKRSRHWSPKVFVLAAVLGVASFLVNRIAASPIFYGASVEELIASGWEPNLALIAIGEWTLFAA